MQALIFVDEFSLKSPEEKAVFFSNFVRPNSAGGGGKAICDCVPMRLAVHRVLPVFISACEFGTSTDVMCMIPAGKNHPFLLLSLSLSLFALNSLN